MQRLSQEDGDFLTVELRKAEDEHVRLNQLLQNLRGTCDKFYSLEGCHGCGKEKVASCQGRLISFKHVFLELVIKHFRNEEKSCLIFFTLRIPMRIFVCISRNMTNYCMSWRV